MSTELGRYALITDQEQNIEVEQVEKKNHIQLIHVILIGSFFTLSFLLVAVIIAIFFVAFPTSSTSFLTRFSGSRPNQQLPDLCNAPPIRREWRALSEEQKQDYIESIRCLAKLPSEIKGEGSIWDDFDWVHETIGQNSHESASFLPWHRNFLHVYQTYLKERCGYKGQLPYWDWALDWQDLAKSSIWSNENGFGGLGNQTGPIGINSGNCITDGPFSDIQLHYYNQTAHPHCLSRTFQHFETNKTGSLSGSFFKPEAIGFLRRIHGHDDERDRLESIAHNGLHWGIEGDFSHFSAANDPIFYLHHTHLDRLWLLWQQDVPETRFTEYKGQAFKNESQPGTLQDPLSTLGLAKNVKVFDVMRTDSVYLCYRY